MSVTAKPLEQRIIVYTPPVQKGEITQGEVPYSTAYTDEQVRDGVMNCVLRHGREARVRAVEARTIKATWDG